MAESTLVDTPKPGKKAKRVGHIKMKVMADLKAETVNGIVEEQIDRQSIIKSDDSTSYVGVSQRVEEHHAKVILNKDIEKELPWVHIAISNAKRWILSNFSKVCPEYLQSYLDEFCYNFNRRYMANCLFDRLLIACATSKNEFRYK